MFSKHLCDRLDETIKEIIEVVPFSEIDSTIGRSKLDQIIGKNNLLHYYAIVSPLKFKVNYFCKRGLNYLGLSDFNYDEAHLGLLTKIIAKENMGMVYQGIQHFMSGNRNLPIELNFRVKRFDDVWRNVFFISKELRYKDTSHGLTTISIIIDIEDYLNREFVKKTNTSILSDRQLAKLNSLTDRELEILILVNSEASSEDIADQLNISIYTVRSHKRSILRKLQVKSSLSLAKYALFAQSNPDYFK